MPTRSLPTNYCLSVLPTVTSIVISELKERKEELKTLVDKQKNLNKKAIARFEEGIAEMKLVELHPAFKSHSTQVLMDIYHKEDIMLDYKNKCLSSEKTLIANLENIAEQAHTRKNTIKVHKQRVKNHVSRWSELESTLASQFKSINESFEAYASKFTKEYLNLKNKLKSIKNDDFDECLLLAEHCESYIQNFVVHEQNFSNIESQVLSFNNEVQKMTCFSSDNDSILKQNIKEFETMDRNIKNLSSQLNKLMNEQLPLVEKMFGKLITPSLMKGAYQELLTEISKRRKTLIRLNEVADSVKQLVEEENKRRQDFLTKTGQILPDKLVNIIPTLKHPVDCGLLFNTDELKKLPCIEYASEDHSADDNKGGVGDQQINNKMHKVFELFSLSSELTEEISIEDFEKNANDRSQLLGLVKNLLVSNTKFLLRQVAQNFNDCEPSEAKREIQNLKKELEEIKGHYNSEVQNNKLITENMEALHIDNKQSKTTIADLRKELKQKESYIQELIEDKESLESDHAQEINSLKFTASNLRNLCDELNTKLSEKENYIQDMSSGLNKYKNKFNTLSAKVQTIFSRVLDFKAVAAKLDSMYTKMIEIPALFKQRESQNMSSTLLVPNKVENFTNSPSNAETESDTVDINHLQDTIEALRIENKEHKLRNDLLDQSLESKNSEIEALKHANCNLAEELKSSKAFSESLFSKIEAYRKNRSSCNFELGDESQSTQLIFVPFEPGIYVPLVKENSNYVLDANSRPIKYVLDIETLPPKYSSIAKNNNFIIVASISGATKESHVTINDDAVQVLYLDVAKLDAIYTFDETSFTLFSLVN